MSRRRSRRSLRFIVGDASFCVAQRSAAEENGVSMLREGGHRPRDARAFLSVCGLTVTSQKATTISHTTHKRKNARRSLDSGSLHALRKSAEVDPGTRTRDHGGLQKQTPTHHTPSVFLFFCLMGPGATESLFLQARGGPPVVTSWCLMTSRLATGG